MNKTQLITSIAERSGLSVNKASEALSAALETIVETLTQGKSVSLMGFGNFGVKQRAPRKVRNPRTGLEMQISATVVPFFKPGKGLKEEVDGLNETN